MSPSGIILLVLLATLRASESVTGPHIADVNLLLPPRMTHPVEYRLQGTDGCFSWSWDHHDILSLEPEYNTSTTRCSTSVRVKSIAPYSGRKETAIYATDLRTGINIRCKVFIDKISRIQIFHNSIKLDLDGLATLRVRAFDDEENVFSSLVGLQFSWGLRPEANETVHHLVHVPLKESPLSDCGGFCGDLDTQITLEDSGVHSDLFAVKGTEIGHEIVSVNLIEPQFENMADKILLTVAEAMSIDPPSPVVVVIGASVHYHLKVIRQNTPKGIELPSANHRWSVVNASVARVDDMMGIAHAINLGTTTINVEDTRVVGHVQMSSLHVVIPDNLCLYKLPVTSSGDPIEGMEAVPSTVRWYVVVGRQYAIHMKVFSHRSGGQEIYITERDDVKLQYNDSVHWTSFVVPESIAVKHGWHNSRILKATSQGLGRLAANLTYHTGHTETTEVLQVVHEVMVCERVKFKMWKKNDSSTTIHLPWAPGIYEEMELSATGGCVETTNGYKWYTSDASTVSVSASGVIQAKKPGQVTVKVVSVHDSTNYDEVAIKVSVPSSMVMLRSFAVESVVGTYLQAAVTMRAPYGSYFDRCDSFSSFIRWTVGSQSFEIVNTTGKASAFKLSNIDGYQSLYSPPCAWTYVYASGVGRAILHATLSKELESFDHPSDEPVVLKASSMISAHHPLVVQQAGNGNQFGGYWAELPTTETGFHLKDLNELYLVPGTELNVMLIGGPEQWDQGVEYVENVKNINGEQLSPKGGILVDRALSNGGLYRISCLTMGIHQLVFSRGNLIGDDHPLPTIEKVELSVTCSVPSSITLIANEPVNTPELISSAAQDDRTPDRIRATPITVANGCTIRVAAVGLHSSGKAFVNSSSLGLNWEMSSCDGLALWDAITVERYRTTSSWERFLVLQNSSGLCIVRATVIGFSDTTSVHLRGRASLLLEEKSKNLLTDAIRLQLVSSLRVVPESILLLFNPEAKATLLITGGTCSLHAVVNDTRVAEVIQPPNLECSQLLVDPRGLGTALITVDDVGLAHLTASARVRVADVDWIKIIAKEEIFLLVGSAQSFNILAGLHDGTVFDSSQYVYMSIHVHFEDPILELLSINASNSGESYIYGPGFAIQANSIGVTTIYVSARQRSGHEVYSDPVRVEVYAPPRIHPNHIFLAPGASYKLTVKGGPSIGVYAGYTLDDETIADIQKTSGRIRAISPGNGSIHVNFFGKGSSFICQAYGSIEVGIPSSMMLSPQSEQLNVGREMPIFPSFTEGNLFSFYELCKDYKWSIEDEQVLSYRSAEHSHKTLVSGALDTMYPSYSDRKDLGFINVVYGRSSGKTNVAVSFSCDFTSESFSLSKMYTASASLWVVSYPPLSLGVPITWILPPFYTTSNLLPESYNQGDSQGRKGTVIYTLMRSCGGKNGEIHKDAISIEGARIKTSDSGDLGCIQAKDRLTGRAEIASCVRVAEVAQVRVTSKEFAFYVADLAVGAELDLLVHYHDALGNPFHEAYDAVQIDADTNYPEVVSINSTRDSFGNIRLKATRHGRALLRISMSNNQQKSDYFMVSVGAHLFPQNPVLYVGRYINFSVGGSDNVVPGRWLSASDNVVSIDMLSGEALARGEGTTQVIFEGSNLKLQTAVTVQKVDVVLVDSPEETLTNIPFPTKGYYFSIRFSDPSGQNFESFSSSKGVNYDCRVDPPYIGYAKPWRDLDLGVTYCLFFPYSPEHLARSIPKSKTMRPDISLSITASMKELAHVSGSSTALFIGGFSVLEMDKDLLRLNLTPVSNKSMITIVGNTDVDIYWQKRDLMSVTPVIVYEYGMGGQAEYEVKALRATRFKDKIIITLPATGQRVEVDVGFEPGETRLSSRSNFALWASIFGVVTLFTSLLIYKKFLNQPATSRPTSAAPRATPIRHTVTPDRNRSVQQQSPRTPEVFLEYVRDTIDKTPYYKRDAVRRRNPQNTF
ncbi:nuclear pore complex protein GP210-like isoform X1 [Papaver somniferum]|uniref:nuclear pore complex protein GP210-like isoform X1 n=1 Tax=Papaver somniferum TaxID=3469 RepID=UPI000E6FFC7F|nr:nuclear pore complex protein GP210-like isoform X1 [Papaver somniferum]